MRASMGDHVHGPRGARQRGRPARRPSPPDADLRSRGHAGPVRPPPRVRAPPVLRRDLRALPLRVCAPALRDRDLPGRPARVRARRDVDVAVHRPLRHRRGGGALGPAPQDRSRARRRVTDESRPRRTIRADRGDAGERLDRVLLRHLNDLPEASRTKIQEWIEAGLVSVNGKTPGKSSEKVRDRDEVIVVLPPPPAPRAPLVPQEIPPAVLFEDSEILVLNKPPGLVVHPAVGHRDGTLVNALLHRSKEWAGPADRPGLVHRLDKDTSGVLVVAKTERAMAVLGRAIKERCLEKEYLAVVYGKPALTKGHIDLKILRDPKDRKRMAASKAGGRPSTTFYEVLSESSGSLSVLALLKCTLF